MMLIKKFDRISINHDQQPTYSMHHNVVHCEFESCKNCCEERSYTADCNEQHEPLDDVEPWTSEKLDELLKFCDTPENEQTRKDAGYVDIDDVKPNSNSKLDIELDPMSKFMLELVGIKLKMKPKEYIDDLVSEVKSMLENKIDIKKWFNDDTISMEKKLEIGYIIKVLGEDMEHKS